MIFNETMRILKFIGQALIHILPFFLMSIIITSSVNQLDSKSKMSNFFKGKRLYSIVFATLIGALSPLCSCGVIPMIFALLRMGFPLAPIMSFWITSPLMSPEAFLITRGHLGYELASVRLSAAILMGFASGIVTFHLLIITRHR